jgi:hypothetical protein
MRARAQIICVALQDEVAEVRRLILESAGHRCTLVGSLHEARRALLNEHFDLAIFSYTGNPEEAKSVEHLVLKSGIPAIQLYWGAEPPPRSDIIHVDIWDGPGKLFSAIRECINRKLVAEVR